MIARNPYVDLPSTDSERCDIGGCAESWAWEAERRNGPRKLRLCEGHADRWLRGERQLAAEREEMAGRVLEPESGYAALFGLARALDAVAKKAG